MNGVTTLVHHCGNIIKLSCGIHENERRARFGKRTVVSARRLALPAFEVEVTEFLHLAKTIAEEGTHFIKAFDSLLDQLFTCLERTKGLNSLGFCINIPGTKCVEAQFFLLSFVDLINQGHHMQLHCFMKLEAIFLGIIKPAELYETIVAVVIVTGIHCDLMPFLQK